MAENCRTIVYLGVWLHGLQDCWAHGTEKEREKYKFKHNDLTDDFRYDHKWSKKNNYKKVKVRYKYKKRKNMKNKEAKNILVYKDIIKEEKNCLYSELFLN